MDNDCIAFGDDFKLFPKEIPQLSIINYPFGQTEIGIFGNISNPCETKAAIAASGNDSFLLFYSILERLHFVVLTLLSH